MAPTKTFKKDKKSERKMKPTSGVDKHRKSKTSESKMTKAFQITAQATTPSHGTNVQFSDLDGFKFTQGLHTSLINVLRYNRPVRQFNSTGSTVEDHEIIGNSAAALFHTIFYYRSHHKRSKFWQCVSNDSIEIQPTEAERIQDVFVQARKVYIESTTSENEPAAPSTPLTKVVDEWISFTGSDLNRDISNETQGTFTNTRMKWKDFIVHNGLIESVSRDLAEIQAAADSGVPLKAISPRTEYVKQKGEESDSDKISVISITDDDSDEDNDLGAADSSALDDCQPPSNSPSEYSTPHIKRGSLDRETSSSPIQTRPVTSVKRKNSLASSDSGSGSSDHPAKRIRFNIRENSSPFPSADLTLVGSSSPAKPADGVAASQPVAMDTEDVLAASDKEKPEAVQSQLTLFTGKAGQIEKVVKDATEQLKSQQGTIENHRGLIAEQISELQDGRKAMTDHLERISDDLDEWKNGVNTLLASMSTQVEQLKKDAASRALSADNRIQDCEYTGAALTFDMNHHEYQITNLENGSLMKNKRLTNLEEAVSKLETKLESLGPGSRPGPVQPSTSPEDAAAAAAAAAPVDAPVLTSDDFFKTLEDVHADLIKSEQALRVFRDNPQFRGLLGGVASSRLETASTRVSESAISVELALDLKHHVEENFPF